MAIQLLICLLTEVILLCTLVCLALLSNGSQVRNLGLVDVNVSYIGVGSSWPFVGGLVGRNDGTIVSSYSTGAVNSRGDGGGNSIRRERVGGLVGHNGGSGTIVSSYSVDMNVIYVGISHTFVGGLVGGE